MSNRRQTDRPSGGVLVLSSEQARALLAKAQTGRSRIHVSAKADRTWHGIVFASKREMTRYIGLVALERSGIIENLRRQVRYPLKVNGQLICTYIADHVYYDPDTRTEIVEDSKGYRTEMYRIKRKLMRAVYGIDIMET